MNVRAIDADELDAALQDQRLLVEAQQSREEVLRGLLRLEQIDRQAAGLSGQVVEVRYSGPGQQAKGEVVCTAADEEASAMRKAARGHLVARKAALDSQIARLSARIPAIAAETEPVIPPQHPGRPPRVESLARVARPRLPQRLRPKDARRARRAVLAG